MKPENGPKWQEGLDSITDVLPELPEREVGARYTKVRRFLGREMNTLIETIELEMNAKWGGKVIEGLVPYEVTASYEA
jgi:hypothetical protein